MSDTSKWGEVPAPSRQLGPLRQQILGAFSRKSGAGPYTCSVQETIMEILAIAEKEEKLMSIWNKLFGKQPRPSKPIASHFVKNQEVAQHADTIMDIEEAQHRGDSAAADKLAHDFVKSQFAKRGIKID